MRILHLADRWTDRGGAYRHMHGVLEHLARDHQVHLAVGNRDPSLPARFPTTLLPGLDSRTRRPVELEPLRRSFRPHVIHVHNVVNPGVLAWAAARDAVVTVQDHRFFCPGRGKWTAAGEICDQPMSADRCGDCFSEQSYFEVMLSLTEERLRALRRLRLVVLSRYMKRELVACGIDEKRIRVIPPFPHGLDRSAPADGPPCVLFAGRLVESKGVWDAVAAWRRSGLSLPLVVAGTGPLREAIRAPGCKVLGWVSPRRLSSLYRRAEAVIFPSRWQEPFGIVGLEALSMRTPVAAWDSGGVREWHPGPGLVRWGDHDGLATALGAAIGRKTEPPRGFEPEQLMARLEDVYRG